MNDVEFAKMLIRRGWDDHLWSFEMMDERDENWLRRWAGMEDTEPPATYAGFPDDDPQNGQDGT